MAELGGTITLENFVRELLLAEGSEIDITFPRYFTFAMRGLREINMYHAHNYPKVSKLTPDSLGRVDFPTDAIEIKAIGVPRGGTLWTLTMKPNMVTTTSTEDGADVYDSDIGEGQDVPIYWYDGYGANGGINVQGYYRIDERQRKIYINNFDGTTIWCYYVSSGVELSGDTLIPRKFQDVLEKYVRWQMASYDDKRDNEIIRKERDYDNAVAKLRTFTWTLDQLRDVLNSVNSQTTRR